MRRLTRRPRRVAWAGQALTAIPGGGVRLRLRLLGRCWLPGVTLDLVMSPGQAGLLHAQLDRLLTQGWARTEVELKTREQGEQLYSSHRDPDVRHTPERKIPTDPEETSA